MTVTEYFLGVNCKCHFIYLIILGISFRGNPVTEYFLGKLQVSFHIFNYFGDIFQGKYGVFKLSYVSFLICVAFGFVDKNAC